MTTAQSLIAPSFPDSHKFGIGPDFAVYTGAMKPVDKKELPTEDQDKPILRMRGSSTIQDLQMDTMMYSALQSMREVPPDLTLWMNHNYSVPDDAFGRLYGMPQIQIIQNGIADLWIAEETFLRNPPAKKTHDLIVLDKARFGCSVGCQVIDWSFESEDDPYSPVLIHKVQVLEWSVCGIPANLRCWVENAIKGLFARSLVEGDGDAALKLAPAFKGLYSRDFSSVVENLTSDTLRKDLQRTPARSTHPHRIMYDFTEAREGFVLSDQRGVMKSLTRDETSKLLETGAPLHLQPVDEEEEVEEEDMGVTKAVSGKTSWPLMDIGTEWTGSKAEDAIFAYAKGDGGEIVPSKAKQGFLYFDTAKDPKTKSAYKMPFTYGGEGGLKIVPLGVRACAGALSGGGREVSASAEDKSGMKAKCKTMYGRINSQFHPDPPWVVPWEKDEKSAKDILDTETGSALIRQDLEEGGSEEEVDKEDKSIEVNSDGSHGAFSGRHSHSHKAYGDQGDDDMHEHSHEHSEDSDHGHSHADKSAEDTINKQAGVKLDEDGNHDDFTGTHTHKHKAFGADDANDDKMHSHDHSHDGDSQHKHPHDAESQKAGDVVINDDGSHEKITAKHTHQHPNYGAKADGNMHSHNHEHQNDNDHHHHGEKSAEPDEQKAGDVSPVKAVDPVQLAYLAMYNEIGAKLGFPVHTLTTKCDLVPTEGDAGIVRSTLTALDDCTDNLEELAERIDGYVDALMSMTGTPDIDDDGTSLLMPGMLYSLHNITVKEGRVLNASNRQLAQLIHDAIFSMHPESCKGQQSENEDEAKGEGTTHQSQGISVEEALEQARAMGQGSEQMVMSLQGLTKALDGINVTSIQEEVGALKTASVALQKSVESLQREERVLLERQDQLKREQDALMGNVAKLKNMPLGRPTGLNRSVVDVERMTIPPATYEEMLAAGGTTSLLDTKVTLREALEQTQIVEVDIVQSSGKLAKTKKRRWPAGLGVDVRPPLTGDQKSMMRLDEWDAYTMGSRVVDVPLIDDPAEALV